MYPHSGGWYVFLNEAYGPLWAFLFGWAGMLVMLTGSMAAVAVGFAEYFSYFFPSLSTTRILLSVPMPWGSFHISAGQLAAAASIAVLGAVNYVGVRMGNAVQVVLTAIKVAVIAAIPMLAFRPSPGISGVRFDQFNSRESSVCLRCRDDRRVVGILGLGLPLFCLG